MKRFFLLGCLFLALSLGSCQCSNKPDIGPVEDEDASSMVGPAPAAVPGVRHA